MPAFRSQGDARMSALPRPEHGRFTRLPCSQLFSIGKIERNR